ncbi:hypothetical protein ACP4OV_018499 [Aristida adscensionis]
MPIEMPRGLPFAVDTWTPASALKRHRFLTHAHRDHLAGVATTAIDSSPIYASRLTALLARRIAPPLARAAFVELDPGAPPLRVPDPDGDFTVAALDANHCPGAVMFLFEGAFGTVLHTGDCRLTPDCLPPPRPRVDYLFLDCTFARCPLPFPSKDDAIRQVIDCIWRHPAAPAVYLVCDMLGQEDVLVAVSRAFGSKIRVDKDSDCHHTLSHVAPEILAGDGDATRFSVARFPRLPERAAELQALARARREPEPLIIRPSTQWYAYYEAPAAAAPAEASAPATRAPSLAEPTRDESGVWHVCFSMHSSRNELEHALAALRPRWVVSTTPPCMAVDLSYVRKHCFLSRLGPDDPIWKLLRIPDAVPAVAGSSRAAVTVEATEKSEEETTCSYVDESGSDGGEQVVVAEPTLEDFDIKVEPPVTLFGSARFGLMQDESELWKHEYESVETIDAVVPVEAEDSAVETVSCNNSKTDESVEVIYLSEVAAKELNSVTESESRKDDGVEVVVYSTGDSRKEQSLSTESAGCKDGKCEDGIKQGNWEANSEAQGQNLIVHADLRKMIRSRVTEEEGKSSAEASCDNILAAHAVVSAKINKEAAEEAINPSEIGKNYSGQDSERASDSSTVVGSSNVLNASLRRLYRSMSVSVPRPLPSLVELMAASKRPRVSQTVQL